MTRYVFAGLTRPIVLEAPPTIEPLFKFFLAHWPWRLDSSAGPGDVVIAEASDGLTLRADAIEIAGSGYDETAGRAQLRKAFGVMIRLLLDLGIPDDRLGDDARAGRQAHRVLSSVVGLMADPPPKRQSGDRAAARADAALRLAGRRRSKLAASVGPDLSR